MATKKRMGYLIDTLFSPFERTFHSTVYRDPRVSPYLSQTPQARYVLSDLYKERKKRVEYALRADLADAVSSILQLGTGSTFNVPTRIIDELTEYTAGGKLSYIREAMRNRDWFTAVGSLVLEAVSFLDPTQITDILPLYTMYEHERLVYDFRKRMKRYSTGF